MESVFHRKTVRKHTRELFNSLSAPTKSEIEELKEQLALPASELHDSDSFSSDQVGRIDDRKFGNASMAKRETSNVLEEPLIHEVIRSLHAERIYQVKKGFEQAGGTLRVTEFVRLIHECEIVSGYYEPATVKKLADLFDEIDVDNKLVLSFNDLMGFIVQNAMKSDLTQKHYFEKFPLNIDNGENSFSFDSNELFQILYIQEYDRIVLCSGSFGHKKTSSQKRILERSVIASDTELIEASRNVLRVFKPSFTNTPKLTFVRELRGHHGAVLCAKYFSPMKLLVSCGIDERLIFWDVDSGFRIRCDFYVNSVINAIEFQNQTDSLMFVTSKGDLTVLDLQSSTSQKILSLQIPDKPRNINEGCHPFQLVFTKKAHSDSATSVIAPITHQCFTCGLDGKICQWEILTGNLLRTLSANEYGVISLSYLFESKLLVSTHIDRRVHLWDPCSPQQNSLHSCVLGTAPIGAAEVMISHNTVKSDIRKEHKKNREENSNVAELLDDSNSEESEKECLISETDELTSKKVDDSISDMFLTVDVQGICKVWETKQYECVQSFSIKENERENDINSVFSGKASSFALFKRAHKTILFVGSQMRLFCYLFDPQRTHNKADFSPIVSIVFNEPRQNFITSSARALKFWDSRSGNFLHSFSPRMSRNLKSVKNETEQSTTAVCYDHSYKKAFVGDVDGGVFVFNLSNGKCLRKCESHQSTIRFLHYTNAGNLISLAVDGSIAFHALTSSKTCERCEVGSELCGSCYSKKFNVLITSHADLNFRRFPLTQTGYGESAKESLSFSFDQRKQCRIHNSVVSSICVLDPRPIGVSVDTDGNIAFWDINRLEILLVINFERKNRHSIKIAFDHKNKLLLGNLREKGLISVFSLKNLFEKLKTKSSYDSEKRIKSNDFVLKKEIKVHRKEITFLNTFSIKRKNETDQLCYEKVFVLSGSKDCTASISSTKGEYFGALRHYGGFWKFPSTTDFELNEGMRIRQLILNEIHDQELARDSSKTKNGITRKMAMNPVFDKNDTHSTETSSRVSSFDEPHTKRPQTHHYSQSRDVKRYSNKTSKTVRPQTPAENSLESTRKLILGNTTRSQTAPTRTRQIQSRKSERTKQDDLMSESDKAFFGICTPIGTEKNEDEKSHPVTAEMLLSSRSSESKDKKAADRLANALNNAISSPGDLDVVLNNYRQSLRTSGKVGKPK